MEKYLPLIFRAILGLLALVAVPVYTFVAGHPVLHSVLEFLAAATALMMMPPGKVAKEKEPPG